MTNPWSPRLALVIAAALAVAAPAAAHITVTVDAVTAPLVVGVPTNVTVHFSEPCFEVLPQEAQGQDTVMAGLSPDAPATMSWAGETVPFTTDMCETNPDPADPFGVAAVRTSAILTITPSADAPGLTNLTLPVTSYLGGGSEPGEVVDLAVTIAHYANGTLVAQTAGHAAHGANGNAIELVFDYTTNAESLLTIEATSSVGEVHEIDATRVTPPAFDNRSSAQVKVPATFEPPANWTHADLTFTAYLTPVAGGPRIEVATARLALANEDSGHGEEHDDGHVHDEAAEDTPGPAFALVALALVALAAARRR